MNKKNLWVYSMLLVSLASKSTNCLFFDEMDKHFQQMEKRMKNMRHMFDEMEQQVHTEGFTNTSKMMNISQNDAHVAISIDLGKGITDFDANIKTKKTGYPKDQIIIKTKKPKKQKIVITIIENYVSINKTTKATYKEQKEDTKKYASSVSASSSTIGRTFDKNLDIEKASIEYDENEGTLTVILPKEKVEEPQGKKIDVKIKSSKTTTKVDGK